ncbi:unnamed protein product [Didymodactylos carnosus]|uniref:ETS domain-containing protein n=1 Tax=Didymodactylos carnosus TaxID=1234261 RepID=A0A814KPM2_9BILA|nr:unnamed protein product [Didymodactylos carnosus]CAF1054904.1 unnamed protein product [Didymodactylos carnosus]CAF3586060.1 unnamed protein product [Didymodactylos carnosus]CAF3824083.1 unnamed protein product [Didymodactylos carnosus]
MALTYSTNDNELKMVMKMCKTTTSEWLVGDEKTKIYRRPYLHEFLRLLLEKPNYRSYASYININEGIFKLHLPSSCAKLWQHVKGRHGGLEMTYDKFARAIRFYYKLDIIRQTSGQFTFQFGPNSGFGTLWKPQQLNDIRKLPFKKRPYQYLDIRQQSDDENEIDGWVSVPAPVNVT